MKRIRIVAAAFGVFLICGMVSAQTNQAPGAMVLSDNWRFKAVEKFSGEYWAQDYKDSEWLGVKIPSQWQSYPGLEKYAGRGVYRLKFDFPDRINSRTYHLRFGGVFYKANVYLNGKKLGSHEGYFEPFEFEVSDLLQPKDNILVVEVECLKEKQGAAKEQILGVFSGWDAISSYRNPGGIWQEVAIVPTGPAWLGAIKFTTVDANAIPLVKIEAEVLGRDLPGLAVNFTLRPDNFEGRTFILSARVIKGKATGEYYLEGARLWWTHDRGFPACYRLTAQLNGTSETLTRTMAVPEPEENPQKPPDTGIYMAPMALPAKGKAKTKSAKNSEPILVKPVPLMSLTMDEKTALVGIRSVTVQDQFHFFVNGKSLYIKGNNYGPSLVYLSETTPELVAKDVEMFRAAHYNMVRVHGHIDSPYLYDAADRGGVLIFQDGPFQGGYSPSITDEAVRETKAYVDLLYNHPSIAIWSVHNEPQAQGVDAAGPNLADKYLAMLTGKHGGKPEKNQLALDPAMADAVKSIDASRPVNLGSGMDCCDTHKYFGWYVPAVDEFATWVEDSLKNNPHALKFVTEFGAQAFPNYDRTADMLATTDLRKMPREKMKLEYMWQESEMDKHVNPRNYKDLKSYVDATQDYQARLLKYSIERLRILKYSPNYGVLCFLHKDSQPAISWSVVDAWRQPKKAYAVIAESFSPVWPMVMFKFEPYKMGEKISLPILVANDTLESYSLKLAVKIEKQGKKTYENSWTVKLEPDMQTKVIDSLTFKPSSPGAYSIRLTLSGEGMANPVENLTEIMVK
jgi:beta-mannosidase